MEVGWHPGKQVFQVAEICRFSSILSIVQFPFRPIPSNMLLMFRVHALINLQPLRYNEFESHPLWCFRYPYYHQNPSILARMPWTTLVLLQTLSKPVSAVLVVSSLMFHMKSEVIKWLSTKNSSDPLSPSVAAGQMCGKHHKNGFLLKSYVLNEIGYSKLCKY